MGRRLDAWRDIASNAGYDGNPLMSTVDAINATVKELGGNGTAQGIADAVTNLAPFIGGGGGVDVGPLTRVSEETAAQPAVGNWGEFGTVIATIKIGGSTITDNDEMAEVPNAAAGTTVYTDVTTADDADTADAYVCTLEGNWTNGWQYKAVTPWDGTVTREEVEYQGETAYRWTFTVPELQEGEWLIIWKHITA